ncbi:MAG: outer membrane beta-barrel protein [Pirellulaceae bacterium]|nr:porin [Planctomycetaceae bacterium]MDG2382482.1 outer membrane beta-barrel protein [Pirellulaceae bacterium]
MQQTAEIRLVTAVLFASALLLPSRVVGQDSIGLDNGLPWNTNWARIDEGNENLWSLLDRGGGPLECGGWISAGFTANAHGNRTGKGNAPLPLNSIADAPVMNQLWLYAEKPLDRERMGADWGFRIDYLFGVDGPEMQAAGDQGWDFGWNTSRDYGSAIPQLYAELGFHELVLRVGYAIGLQGFEANQAVDNFFYSHNYAYGYGVPGTFSGAVLEYELSDNLAVLGGWTTGWDSWWSNYLSASTFVGGLTWTLSDEVSLTYHVTIGDFGDGTAKNGAKSNAGQIYAHAIVFTCEISERASYVLENTLGSNSHTGVGSGNSQWYSLTNYLFYDLSDCWSAGARIEWFCDEDGQRVNVNGAGPGSFYEGTLGINWEPHGNIRIRPEVRWDWFTGQGRPFDSRNGGMTGTSVHQFTGGLDVLLIF